MRYDANIDSASIARLRAMWKNVDYWMKAANGKVVFYNNARDRLLARDVAIRALRDYCDFLDRVTEKYYPRDRDKPREAA